MKNVKKHKLEEKKSIQEKKKDIKEEEEKVDLIGIIKV